MTQLRLQTKQVNLVNDNDLANFIQSAYDLASSYELVALEELSNGNYKLFNVQAEPLSAYEQKQLDQFKAGSLVMYITDVLLKDLCNKGWLEPGNYLVRVFW